MADTKTTALTALTTPADGDLLYIVDDPTGTPVSKKITVADLLNKTGADANTVSGTAGTNGQLAQWNADGDLVGWTLSVDLTADVTGALPAANGGTGQTSLGAVDAADFGSGAATDGHVLTADGLGGAAWEAVSGGSGDFLADGTVDMTGTFGTDVGTFRSDVADGASAVGFDFDTANTIAIAGGLLQRWRNNGALKASIDKDGVGRFVQVDVGSSLTGNVTGIGESVGGTLQLFSNNNVLAAVRGLSNVGFQIFGTLPISWTSTGAVGDSNGDAGILKPAASTLRIVGNGLSNNGHLQSGTYELREAYTVAGLPAGTVGQIARVTDANSPSVGSTVSGGGAAAALVWYNGSNWTVIGI